MEETRKSPNGHGGDKKMVIKVGGGGCGGGIGAVVLLGGALATAALASAFAVRFKRRSSGEDSSREINEKNEDDIMRKGGEEVGLKNDSAVVISDPSLKLDVKAKCETDAENDAVSEDGFIIVKEEIPLLAEKFKVEFITEDVSNDHQSNEGDSDDEINATSNEEEDAEVKEIEPREEENSEEGHDQIVQTKEFEGFCDGNGEINEEKCVEKTILPLFEGHAVEQDDVVGEEEEEAPLPSEGVEMVGADHDKVEEKSDEEEKKLIEIETGGEEKGGKFSLENKENIGGKASMQCDGGGGNGEEKVNGGGGEESKWEALWKAESTKEKMMKYEVGGKIEEDRVHEMMMNKDDSSLSTRRVMIWMVCVLSSLSCSWFFDFSFAKLALFLFLTVFLLEIYGFSLLNRHHHHLLQKEVLATNKDIHKRGSSKRGNI